MNQLVFKCSFTQINQYTLLTMTFTAAGKEEKSLKIYRSHESVSSDCTRGERETISVKSDQINLSGEVIVSLTCEDTCVSSKVSLTVRILYTSAVQAANE